MTVLTMKEVARFEYRCRHCDYRWSEYTDDAKFCPSCRGPAKLYGLTIENRMDDDDEPRTEGPASLH